MLNRKDCQKAAKRWQTSKRNLNEVLRLIPSNYVFTISNEVIQWIKKHNQNDYFHAYFGVHENKAIAMFFPLDSSGSDLSLKEYGISYVQELENEIRFVEQEVTTLTKIAVLSKDLKVISKVKKETLPLPHHDIACQDTILAEVEDWRNDSADWFYKQIKDFNGDSIFNVFTIPIEDLGAGDCDVIGLFAFKYSKVYSQIIPTIIFVQDESDLLENTKLFSIQSNVFNWSQPCPPFCREDVSFKILEV